MGFGQKFGISVSSNQKTPAKSISFIGPLFARMPEGEWREAEPDMKKVFGVRLATFAFVFTPGT